MTCPAIKGLRELLRHLHGAGLLGKASGHAGGNLLEKFKDRRMALMGKPKNGKVSQITQKEFKRIIEAGVAALKVQDLTREGVRPTDSGDDGARWQASRDRTQEFAQSPQGKQVLAEVNGARVQQCLEWVQSQRAHREPFWQKVLTHIVASAIVGVLGFLTLAYAAYYEKMHLDDPNVRAAVTVGRNAVSVLLPEAGNPSPAHGSSSGH